MSRGAAASTVPSRAASARATSTLVGAAPQPRTCPACAAPHISLPPHRPASLVRTLSRTRAPVLHPLARFPPPQWAARRGGSRASSAAAETAGRRYSRAWSSTSMRMSWRSCAAQTCRWGLLYCCVPPAVAAAAGPHSLLGLLGHADEHAGGDGALVWLLLEQRRQWQRCRGKGPLPLSRRCASAA